MIVNEGHCPGGPPSQHTCSVTRPSHVSASARQIDDPCTSQCPVWCAYAWSDLCLRISCSDAENINEEQLHRWVILAHASFSSRAICEQMLVTARHAVRLTNLMKSCWLSCKFLQVETGQRHQPLGVQVRILAPGGLPCGSLRRQYSLFATASCRTAFVVKSKAAAVPPVASHQSMIRCRCAS